MALKSDAGCRVTAFALMVAVGFCQSAAAADFAVRKYGAKGDGTAKAENDLSLLGNGNDTTIEMFDIHLL